jgi:hypothetical protein
MKMVIEMAAVEQWFPSPQIKRISDMFVTLFYGVFLFGVDMF